LSLVDPQSLGRNLALSITNQFAGWGYRRDISGTDSCREWGLCLSFSGGWAETYGRSVAGPAWRQRCGYTPKKGSPWRSCLFTHPLYSSGGEKV